MSLAALEKRALAEVVELVAHVEGITLRQAREAVLALSLDKTAPTADENPACNFSYGYWRGVQDARATGRRD